jgi:hypothetical protein
MNVIFVSYDLNGKEPPESYKRLYLAIHLQGKAIWTQYSAWIISTNKTDIEVRESLLKYTDSDDSLFVATLSSFASYNIPIEAANLIKGTWNPNFNSNNNLQRLLG